MIAYINLLLDSLIFFGRDCLSVIESKTMDGGCMTACLIKNMFNIKERTGF